MVEYTHSCPNGGEKRIQMEENKNAKWDTTKIILAITAGIAVLALVGLLGWMVGSGMIGGNSGTTGTQEQTPEPTTSGYAVSGEAATAANGNIVAKVGDLELTNGQLQVHYWSQVYNFLNYYGSYIAYLGVDFTKPLSDQVYDATNNMTWEEFFLEIALENWSQMATISMMAEENGFTLSQEQQEELAATIENLEKNASSYGYADWEEMVTTEMGEGATPDDYIAYVKLDYFCSAYYKHLKEQNAPNETQINDYYAENESTIVSAGYGKDAGKVVDVRHILIKPEGGTLNDDGYTYTYTDAQWEAARQAAQVVYDLWLAGEKNEDSFAELAKKHSADSSSTKGGLITDLAEGKTVEGFNDWIFADGREYGDHGLVKSVYGYHVMFYVATKEAWIRYCEENYASGIASAEMEKFAEDYTIETNYDLIALGQVDLAG